MSQSDNAAWRRRLVTTLRRTSGRGPWIAPSILVSTLAIALGGCSPTVKIEAPDKPIVINLNVKIEQEVRVRVEKDVDALLQSKPGVF
jgi:hypothetical protein